MDKNRISSDNILLSAEIVALVLSVAAVAVIVLFFLPVTIDPGAKVWARLVSTLIIWACALVVVKNRTWPRAIWTSLRNSRS